MGPTFHAVPIHDFQISGACLFTRGFALSWGADKLYSRTGKVKRREALPRRPGCKVRYVVKPCIFFLHVREHLIVSKFHGGSTVDRANDSLGI